jgi:hypothetical protein
VARPWGEEARVKRREEVHRLSVVDVLEPLAEEEPEELDARCPDIRLERGEDFYRSQEHDGELFLIEEGPCGRTS